MGQHLVDKADFGSQVVTVDVEGEEATDVACNRVGSAKARPHLGVFGGSQEIPRPPMIRTAGLSSPGPVMVEPERVSASLNSAIVGVQSITSGIDCGLQTQCNGDGAEAIKL